jgi:hypothetical protein
MDLKAGAYEAESIMNEIRISEHGNQNPSSVESYEHARALAKGEQDGNH